MNKETVFKLLKAVSESGVYEIMSFNLYPKCRVHYCTLGEPNVEYHYLSFDNGDSDSDCLTLNYGSIKDVKMNDNSIVFETYSGERYGVCIISLKPVNLASVRKMILESENEQENNMETGSSQEEGA